MRRIQISQTRCLLSDMKRTLAIAGLSVLAILAAVLIFSHGTGARPGDATTRSLVVTQDGKLIFDAQPEGYSKPTIIMVNPKRNTNASGPAVNPK